MKTKRFFSLILTSVMVLCLVPGLYACSSDANITQGTNAGTAAATAAGSSDIEHPNVNSAVKHDADHNPGYQLEKPAEGDEIAIMHTSMGDISIRLFPENAPKAVENFIALAKAGKYNDNIFHRVINNFMVQCGDYENSNGTGGTSSFGSPFEDEFCDSLYNIRGSLAMANSGANTNGSQFFINQSPASQFNRANFDYDNMYKQLKSSYEQNAASYKEQFTSQFPTLEAFISANGGINPLSYAVPDAVWKLYEENGGNIHLDGALRASGGHTVFGQVIDGMDVVDAIAAVEVDSASNKPVKDVTIKSIEITTYTAQ